MHRPHLPHYPEEHPYWSRDVWPSVLDFCFSTYFYSIVSFLSSVPLIICKVITGFDCDGNSVTFLSVKTGEDKDGESPLLSLRSWRPLVSGDFSPWITSMAFFAVAEAYSSPSSSDESHPSESGSSFDVFAVANASAETSFILFLFRRSFLTSQNALRT